MTQSTGTTTTTTPAAAPAPGAGASQVRFGAAPSGSPTNVGSIFGLDYDQAIAPLIVGHRGVTGSADSLERTGQTSNVIGTVLDGVRSYYNLSASDRADAIRKLVSAGYLSKTEADSPQAAFSAWRAAVMDAARGGTTVLDQLNTTTGVDAVEQRAPFVAQVTNPQDIAKGFKQALSEAIGSVPLSDEQIAAVAKRYQDLQVSSQRQQYDLGAKAAGGGTVVQEPSLAAFADTEAKKIDPTAYDAYKVLDRFSVLEKMLTGGQ